MPGSPITFNSLDNTVLADTIGRATGGFLGDYKRGQQAKNEGTLLQEAFQQLSQNPNATTPDIMSLLAGLQKQGVSPQTIQQYGEPLIRGVQAQQKGQTSNGLEIASKALDSLESLIGQEGIGISGVLNPSGKARYNRGVFESTQAAILPLFKSMFPRGMTEKEFKFIQDKYIPQPSDTEEKIKGKISGLRQLLSNSQQSSPPELPKTSERQQNEKPLDSIKLRHKGSGKIAEVPRERFAGLPVPEQELYEQI